MEISGRVQNGVVVLDEGFELPEGARVIVVCDAIRILRRPGARKRVELPLAPTGEPGTLKLTAEKIAEIFEEDDIASYRKSFRPHPPRAEGE
ncbi:MAG: hypothetical protein ACREJM_05175 [Candidatus Saccharimonadales bacterium]